MADDLLVEKVFNFICESGGYADFSLLLRDSSPLKNTKTKLEAKNWLITQARGLFVLMKDINDVVIGVRIELKKKICQQYLESGSCRRAQGKCKFWHICKTYIEGNCDGKCRRSHNFFDTDNEEKTKGLRLEKHPNGTVRNIVAWSLPQVCQLYLRSECKSDNCPYLHLCSNVVRVLPCSCPLSHALTDGHNKNILKQYDLVPHQAMKTAFVCSSILVMKEQRFSVIGKSSDADTNVETTTATTVNKLPSNNLMTTTTASASCKKCPDFLNVQGEVDEIHSDSSLEDNTPASADSFKPANHSKKKSKPSLSADKCQIKYQMPAFSLQSSSITSKPSSEKVGNDSDFTHANTEPQKKLLVDQCVVTDNNSIPYDTRTNWSSGTGSGMKTTVNAVPNDLPVLPVLPVGDIGNDFVTKWVMGSGGYSSGPKETLNLENAQAEAVRVDRLRKLSISSSCSSVPDPQKGTPSRKAVFDCILRDYNGIVTFPVISKRQDLFPEGCEDIATWFRARKENFLLNESKEGTPLEVSTYCRRAKLCFNQDLCSSKECPYLHVCREYIAGFCRFGSGCQRNHSFEYDESRKFISKLKLNGLSEDDLRNVVQLSIPKVCLDYNEGQCEGGQSCSRIHICKDMIRRKCVDEEDCGLQHHNALLTAHSTTILQNYGLKIRDGNFHSVLRVLLICEKKAAVGSKPCTKGAATASGKMSNQGGSIPDGASVISSEPSERKVFECLCKEYDCSVSFSVIAKRKDLFPAEFKDIESWFRKRKGSFLLTENCEGIITQVDAFSAKTRLCFSYSNAHVGTCKKENCSYMHVCKDYITDSCSNGATCPRNHQFHNEKDKSLLLKIHLDQFTDQQLRRLVLSSTPLVCVEYNDGLCHLGDDCSRIHLCSDHLKRCRTEGFGCELDHESALFTGHTKAILERYHMDHLKSEIAKKIILVYDDSTKDKERGHVHRYKPDTPICSDFILGKCKKGFKCSGHHCPLPYHWQYRVEEADVWKSFSETDNEKLEKLYCDVMLEEYSATSFQISFERKLMTVQKDFELITNIRRLSTEPFATNPRNPVATVWTWYWKDENGMWLEFGVDHLGKDLQQPIEDLFLTGTNCVQFKISNQDYALYFFPTTDMYQENLRSGTTRKVRRRPAEFKSAADIQELRRSHSLTSYLSKPVQSGTSATVASHWTPMPPNEQYRRVPLSTVTSEYQEVVKLFQNTIKKSVVIWSIERVQNPFMWDKYQRKKENMLAVMTNSRKRTSVNERRLFHGTSPEAVEAICKQNFDWRLHGKNATLYGEGSYFALNASYSDAYAKKDGDSSQFLFLAKVLVGSYTKGQSSYRRPPQKNPSNPASDLYDSCVDDKSNPTIFVVFDTDQFYPEYILRYSTAQQHPKTTLQPRTAPLTKHSSSQSYTHGFVKPQTASSSSLGTASSPIGFVGSSGYSSSTVSTWGFTNTSTTNLSSSDLGTATNASGSVALDGGDSVWYSIACQAAHGAGFQQTVATTSVPKRRRSRAQPLGASQPKAPQVHTSSSSSAESSSNPASGFYMFNAVTSRGYYSPSNTIPSTPYHSTMASSSTDTSSANSSALNTSFSAAYSSTESTSTAHSSGLNTSSSTLYCNTATKSPSGTSSALCSGTLSAHSSALNTSSSASYRSTASSSSAGTSSAYLSASNTTSNTANFSPLDTLSALSSPSNTPYSSPNRTLATNSSSGSSTAYYPDKSISSSATYRSTATSSSSGASSVHSSNENTSSSAPHGCNGENSSYSDTYSADSSACNTSFSALYSSTSNGSYRNSSTRTSSGYTSHSNAPSIAPRRSRTTSPYSDTSSTYSNHSATKGSYPPRTRTLSGYSSTLNTSTSAPNRSRKTGSSSSSPSRRSGAYYDHNNTNGSDTSSTGISSDYIATSNTSSRNSPKKSSYSGRSSGYSSASMASSKAPNRSIPTSVSPGSNTSPSATAHHSKTRRSYPEYGTSKQSGSQRRSSSKDKFKCLVM